MRIDLILFAGVTITLGAAAQTPMKYEDSEFQLPAGWTASQGQDGMTLRPSGLDAGVTETVTIRPSEPLVGSFAAWWGSKFVKDGNKV